MEQSLKREQTNTTLAVIFRKVVVEIKENLCAKLCLFSCHCVSKFYSQDTASQVPGGSYKLLAFEAVSTAVGSALAD